MGPVLREKSFSRPVEELILNGGEGQNVPWELRAIERAKINYFG